MTTNIFDGNAKVMATDSRWSIEIGQWLFYLDDSGYDKIERCNGFTLMFAGDGGVIQMHKDWIRSKPNDFSAMPGVKGMSVCMVEDSNGVVAFQKHQDIETNNVLCAGTGARLAFNCWALNKCSKRAVETAKSKDYCSGGDVKYVDFKTQETNLVPAVVQQLTIQTVTQNILKRGLTMKIQSTPTGVPNLPFPKAEAGDAANDEQMARNAAAALAADGKLTANAPCDGMHNEWSDDDQQKFKAALGRMFGWK